MRLGLLPSQQRALDRTFKKARAFDTFRHRTRRAFIGMGLLVVGAGAGGFLLGRAWSSADTLSIEAARARWLLKLPWARTYAEQPLATLSTNYGTFLMTIQMTGGDDATWRGYGRLAEHALATPGVDPTLRRTLLQTIKLAPPPEWMHPVIERLEKAD